MSKFITKIDIVLENTQKQVVIDLQGKNLIVTGANGCGKTRFLNQLFQRIASPIPPEYFRSSEAMSILFQKMGLEIQDFVNLHSSNIVLRFFHATRQYAANKIDHNATVQSMRDLAKQGGFNQDTSVNFESYLVTYLNAGYMAYALRQDESEKQKVDAWLANITSDLRFLFEDDSLELEYREKEKRFYILQQGKDPFTFEQLSSGYSAILAIYTDLLMKVELQEITPQELAGIVIIDEIDAHLHVSLQKKILAFFDHAYPNIQFIVSTHSSLVIQSVDNAVIYDLSKLEQLEDLSMYSADAITKGLLGTSVTSDTLADTVKALVSITSKVAGNEEQIKTLIGKLRANEQGLDSRAKVALLMAEQSLLDFELEG